MHDETLEARVQGYWNRITSQLFRKHEKDYVTVVKEYTNVTGNMKRITSQW